MLVTWIVLRTPRQQATVPWQPEGATWRQAGCCGPGCAEPPDARQGSELATWPDRAGAEAGPPAAPDQLAGRTGSVVHEPAAAAT